MSTLHRYTSPLRYPGGKGRMAPYLADLFAAQYGFMDIAIWVEPYAGGLGAGLRLLELDAVEEVWFAEKNPGLAAFWRCIAADPESVARQVETLTPTLAAYYEAAAMLATATATPEPDLDLAIAAFLVNRCSRSGIIAANVGPIGGKQQAGRWGIADRFNAPALADRIRRITPYARRLRYLGDDALTCITDLDGTVGIEDELMLFVDPPYIREGNRLYAHGMNAQDHRALADALNQSPVRWALTYDAEPAVAQVLYPDRRIMDFSIPHTSNKQQIAREYLVFSPDVDVLDCQSVVPRGDALWLRDFDTEHQKHHHEDSA